MIAMTWKDAAGWIIIAMLMLFVVATWSGRDDE